MNWFVDASVVIAALLPEEPLADTALEFLSSEESLAACDLIDAEIANALSRNIRRGRLTLADALQHQEWWFDRGALLYASRPLLPDALKYAGAGLEHTYDLVQVLTARANNSSLVTLDVRLIESLRGTELETCVIKLTHV